MFSSVHFCALLDICGGSTITPFLPLIAKKHGLASVSIGMLQSMYGIFQMMCSPFVAYFSDMHGRQAALLLGFAACIISGILLLLFETLASIIPLSPYLLFIVIAPMACLRHTQTTLKSIITDEMKITINNNNNNNMKKLSKLQMQQQKIKESSHLNSGMNNMAKWSFSCYIGAMLGPFIARFANEHISLLACFTILLFGIAAFTTFTFMNHLSSLLLKKQQKQSSSPSSPIKKKMKKSGVWSVCFNLNPKIRKCILLHFIAYFALNLYRSGFVLSMEHRFHTGISGLSYVFSYRGLIGSCMNLYLSNLNLKKKTKKKSFTPLQLLYRALALLGFAGLGFAMAGNLSQVYVVMILQECGVALFQLITN